MNITTGPLQPQFIALLIIFFSFVLLTILFMAIWGISKRQVTRQSLWTTRVYLVKTDLFDGSWAVGCAIVAIILAAIMGGSWVLAAIPENPVYWTSYNVTGTIENVSNNHKSSDSTLYDGCYTFQLGTGDVFDTCDDRITSLDGRKLEFRCVKNWQYQANDFWTCDIRTPLAVSGN